MTEKSPAFQRKPLSKRTRFEIFKRDSFRCQYCGAAAPDVVLEVDRIKPVAAGAPEDMIRRIVTSARSWSEFRNKMYELFENSSMWKTSE